MSKHPSKPQTRATPEAPAPSGGGSRVMNNITGRVTHDERGTAIWEWAGAADAQRPETATQKLKKLDNATLSLADDAPPTSDGVKHNPLGTVKGYSPYDSGFLHKQAPPRKKDLKRLSEWLKLKEQAANCAPEDE